MGSSSLLPTRVATSCASYSNNFSDVLRTMIPLDLHQLKLLLSGLWGAAVMTMGTSPSGPTSGANSTGGGVVGGNMGSIGKNRASQNHLLNEIDTGVGLEAKILSKVVSNMDRWIDMVEKFTVTPKWTSLMKIFQGTEAILGMLAQTQYPSLNGHGVDQQQTMINTNTDEFERLMQPLPARVQTLSMLARSLIQIANCHSRLATICSMNVTTATNKKKENNLSMLAEFTSEKSTKGKMSAQAIKKLGPTLKEIRIHLCQRSPSSNGVRQFVDKHYMTLKKNNPSLPVLVRECSSIEPKIWFRYEYGKEVSVPVGNLSADQIVTVVNGQKKSTE